jgi:hypothetical protein
MAQTNENLMRARVIYCPSAHRYHRWGFDKTMTWQPLEVVEEWPHRSQDGLFLHNDLAVLVDTFDPPIEGWRWNVRAFDAGAINLAKPLIEQYQTLQLDQFAFAI